jgi:hypothetical protein
VTDKKDNTMIAPIEGPNVWHGRDPAAVALPTVLDRAFETVMRALA